MRLIGLDWFIWSIYLTAVSGAFWMPLVLLMALIMLEFFAFFTFFAIPPIVPDLLFWGWYPFIGFLGTALIAIWIYATSREKEWYQLWNTNLGPRHLVYLLGFLALLLSHWIYELFLPTNYMFKVPLYGLAALVIFIFVGWWDYNTVMTKEKNTSGREGNAEEVDLEEVERRKETSKMIKKDHGYGTSHETKKYWMPVVGAVFIIFISNWIFQVIYANPLLDQYIERNIQLGTAGALILFGLIAWYCMTKKEDEK